jgi:hypothetical protein
MSSERRNSIDLISQLGKSNSNDYVRDDIATQKTFEN